MLFFFTVLCVFVCAVFICIIYVYVFANNLANKLHVEHT